MTIYLIHLDRRLHTCPANADPHPYDTRRTILAITDGGPCRTPATIRSGSATITVPCRRQLPADQQCGACRNLVVEHSITDTDDGWHGSTQRPGAAA